MLHFETKAQTFYWNIQHLTLQQITDSHKSSWSHNNESMKLHITYQARPFKQSRQFLVEIQRSRFRWLSCKMFLLTCVSYPGEICRCYVRCNHLCVRLELVFSGWCKMDVVMLAGWDECQLRDHWPVGTITSGPVSTPEHWPSWYPSLSPPPS